MFCFLCCPLICVCFALTFSILLNVSIFRHLELILMSTLVQNMYQINQQVSRMYLDNLFWCIKDVLLGQSVAITVLCALVYL